LIAIMIARRYFAPPGYHNRRRICAFASLCEQSKLGYSLTLTKWPLF
jgi:hypothetical protein